MHSAPFAGRAEELKTLVDWCESSASHSEPRTGRQLEPAGLLDGPVLSGPLAQPGADAVLRDPLYHARSGYLYLLQHDIRELLQDAAAGWTFLRKLVQLPVLLPRIERSTMERMVARFLGDVATPTAPPEPVSEKPATPAEAAGEVGAAAIATPTTEAPRQEPTQPSQEESAKAPFDLAKLERHPVVRQRLTGHWHRPDDAGQGRGAAGRTRRAAAPKDDVTWTVATAKVGLDPNRDKTAAKALRNLLREDDSHLLAALARRLL